MQIKFGTDGWRDLIAENYTFENVHRVSRGAGLYFKKHKKAKAGVFVGYGNKLAVKPWRRRPVGGQDPGRTQRQDTDGVDPVPRGLSE